MFNIKKIRPKLNDLSFWVKTLKSTNQLKNSIERTNPNADIVNFDRKLEKIDANTKKFTISKKSYIINVYGLK